MKKLASIAAVSMLAACSSTPDGSNVAQSVSKAFDITDRLHPYRIDVRQGNMVTQEMVAQLRPGQTRDQVRFVLGTPMLADLFHADRWDYVYRLQKGNGEIQQRRLIVFFADGKLVRVGGDVVAEDPSAAAAAPAKPAARVIEIKAPEQPAKAEEKKPEAAAVEAK